HRCGQYGVCVGSTDLADHAGECASEPAPGIQVRILLVIMTELQHHHIPRCRGTEYRGPEAFGDVAARGRTILCQVDDMDRAGRDPGARRVCRGGRTPGARWA